jgi:hypothetical protein
VRLSDSEAASYIQDSWKPRQSVLVEAGLRQDWDRLFDHVVFSPRLGVSWAPPRLESTKVSAGYGLVYEEANLLLFSRPTDQYLLTTYFAPDGTAEPGPVRSVYTIGPGPLKSPRFANYSASVEQRFAGGLFARLEYIGRRGRDGVTYVDTAGVGGSPPLDVVYQLRNLRRDTYDACALTLRQTFHKQYEWLASYTRSRARSTAVVDASVDQPLLVSNNTGRMPWDAPNRVLSWAYLPVPLANWAVAFLMEARNGYPFSVQNSLGAVQGGVDSFRFPMFFELNLHLERRFVFRNNRWAVRFGFNNITNHQNPNVVDNDTSSPHFLALYGGQSRAFNVRLRWLGKN